MRRGREQYSGTNLARFGPERKGRGERGIPRMEELSLLVTKGRTGRKKSRQLGGGGGARVRR